MTDSSTYPTLFQSILIVLSVVHEGDDDVLATIADLAVKISEYHSISRIRPLVVTSCETAYTANIYAKRLSQRGKDCYTEKGSLAEKLARLTKALNDILLLSIRIASRGRLSATLVGYLGFWESNKIQRLQNILKAMIIHDFWPEDQKRFNIRRKIEEMKLQVTGMSTTTLVGGPS